MRVDNTHARTGLPTGPEDMGYKFNLFIHDWSVHARG
jgi:hypothetical protein